MADTRDEATTVGPPVPFDPELGAVLSAIGDSLPKFHSLETIPETRQAMKELAGLTPLDAWVADGRLTVTEHTMPARDDAPEIEIIVIRPSGATGPLPVLYHLHGGGMVVGDARTLFEDNCVWAERYGAAIVSVDYRLAPETPHPGPVEDCYAGLVWTAEHAEELGLDAARIIVTGASAGGGLAAAVTLMARDRGGPAVAAQVLLCPMLDDRNDTPSAVQGADRGVWNRDENHVGWSALLGAARGTAEVSPYAAPARETDCSNLPPTYIDVGTAEVFRDEDIAYASAIWRAGGQAELHVFSGGFHGYDAFVPQAQVSAATRAARLNWLDRLFEQLAD